MSLRGRSVLIQYHEDANPELWQERILLAGDTAGTWIALTPDEDFVKLKLAEYSYRVMSEARELLVGIKERDCYLVFRPRCPNSFYRPAELEKLKSEAAEMLALEGLAVRPTPPALLPEAAEVADDDGGPPRWGRARARAAGAGAVAAAAKPPGRSSSLGVRIPSKRPPRDPAR
jgi:hypothetical protein